MRFRKKLRNVLFPDWFKENLFVVAHKEVVISKLGFRASGKTSSSQIHTHIVQTDRLALKV